MDSIALVEEQIRAGHKLVERLNRAGIPVTAAAWVKPTERFRWYLYLVTPLVSEERGTKPAYQRINPVVRELQDEGAWIEPLEVRAIGPTDAAGEAIAELSRQYPTRMATPYGGARLGDLSIDGAYIYAPVPAPATS